MFNKTNIKKLIEEYDVKTTTDMQDMLKIYLQIQFIKYLHCRILTV